MDKTHFQKLINQPKSFINRELSWIRFNERVLEEAADKSHPILERLKFLAIFSSNLDEFFMIRVSGLKEQVNAEIIERPADGLSPAEQLQKIQQMLNPLIQRHQHLLQNEVLPELRKKGVRLRTYALLSESQKKYVSDYFHQHLFPILTPLAVDPSHPFPQLRNMGLNLLVELKENNKKAEIKIAVVPIPTIVPRFLYFHDKKKTDIILLEDIIEEHIEALFPNMKIMDISRFRITRNADLDIAEAEADDLLKLIEKELRKRRLGSVIRLEVSKTMSPDSRKFLVEECGLEETDVYEVDGHIGTERFFKLMEIVQNPDLKDEPFVPSIPEQILQSKDIFEAIRKRDILLHHPYDSFSPVIDLIQQAAKDPSVLAIKQTLYRTSGSKSPIVQALKEAAANGKEVTALIELKARFDEETNIVWAKELERGGVNVVYGLLGLKTHCKVMLIVRQEKNEIRHYVHLSTGNYNESSAKVYTDIGLLTCNPDIGQDISELFNFLTGYSRQENWRKILVAPVNLRESFVELIDECIREQKPEQPSHIRMVMNSLVDPELIAKLYEASYAGVKIELLVRGICCLVPGLKDLSENITVKSIVGRFLEHCRIFHFESNGSRKLFCGSADWMPRNLNRRVELVFPIESQETQEELLEILDHLFKDNQKARILQPDGTYSRSALVEGEESFSAQDYFLQEAIRKQKYLESIIYRYEPNPNK
ncbi:MAG: polyphosphate kinase 1 [Bacteroidia bacterium]|nr:polyphosphate kinase 1 [Bacteroidia bacterium]